jgi:hypothetical protein
MNVCAKKLKTSKRLRNSDSSAKRPNFHVLNKYELVVIQYFLFVVISKFQQCEHIVFHIIPYFFYLQFESAIRIYIL